MRWLFALIVFNAGTTLLFAQESTPSTTYSGGWIGALVNGEQYTPDSFPRFWERADPAERALAVGNLLALGANPLSSGFAKLDVHRTPRVSPDSVEGSVSPDSRTSGPSDFASKPLGQAGGAGLPASRGGGAGGPAGGGGGNPGAGQTARLRRAENGSPLVEAPVDLGAFPLDRLAFVSPTEPIPPYTAAPNYPLPNWEALALQGNTVASASPWETGSSANLLQGDFSPNSPGQNFVDPIPSTVATPEPATLSLSLLGILGYLASRRPRNRSLPAKST